MRFLGIAKVERMVGYSRSQIYRLIKAGKFPAGFRPDPDVASIRWRSTDIEHWQILHGASAENDAGLLYTEIDALLTQYSYVLTDEKTANNYIDFCIQKCRNILAETG